MGTLTSQPVDRITDDIVMPASYQLNQRVSSLARVVITSVRHTHTWLHIALSNICSVNFSRLPFTTTLSPVSCTEVRPIRYCITGKAKANRYCLARGSNHRDMKPLVEVKQPCNHDQVVMPTRSQLSLSRPSLLANKKLRWRSDTKYIKLKILHSPMLLGHITSTFWTRYNVTKLYCKNDG